MATIVALATAIGAISGAVQAVAGAASWVDQQWKDRNPSQFARSPALAIEFWQRDKKAPIYDNPVPGQQYYSSRVRLDTEPFEIRFPIEYRERGLRIVTWTDPSVFDIQPGGAAEDPETSVFGVGRGMADATAGGSVLMVSNEGFGYFIDERVARLSSEQGAVYFNTWLDVENRRGESNSPIDDLAGKHLYAVAWVDVDDDRQTDNGEFEYFDLEF